MCKCSLGFRNEFKSDRYTLSLEMWKLRVLVQGLESIVRWAINTDCVGIREVTRRTCISDRLGVSFMPFFFASSATHELNHDLYFCIAKKYMANEHDL